MLLLCIFFENLMSEIEVSYILVKYLLWSKLEAKLSIISAQY